MTDWATDTAAQLWCKPEHSKKEMDVDFGMSIAAALRKAKADGMREAGKIMDDLPSLDQFTYGLHQISVLANQIEKGQ